MASDQKFDGHSSNFHYNKSIVYLGLGRCRVGMLGYYSAQDQRLQVQMGSLLHHWTRTDFP